MGINEYMKVSKEILNTFVDRVGISKNTNWGKTERKYFAIHLAEYLKYREDNTMH